MKVHFSLNYVFYQESRQPYFLDNDAYLYNETVFGYFRLKQIYKNNSFVIWNQDKQICNWCNEFSQAEKISKILDKNGFKNKVIEKENYYVIKFTKESMFRIKLIGLDNRKIVLE